MRSTAPISPPTVTTAPVMPWVNELFRSLGGFARSYLPGAPIDARTRQQVILAVTESNGCHTGAWVHGAWAEFVGEAERADVTDALLDYARASAEAGTPLDPGPLGEVLSADALAALRATVAHSEVATLVGNTAERLFERLAGRCPFEPATAIKEAATVLASAPVAVPLLVFGALLRRANRLAPPMPTIDTPPPDEANLLVHLLVDAAPGYLSSSAVRSLLLGLPVPVSIALRSGRTAATVEFGQGQLAIRNGVKPDAWVVLEGDIEPLLRAASGALAREFGTIRIRPN